MDAPELPFFQAPAPALRHLPLVHEPRRIDAEGEPHPPPPPRPLDRQQHGAALMARIDEIQREVGNQPLHEDTDPPEPAPEDTGGQAARRSPNTSRWALGPKLRAKGGSLIHDVWQGPVVDLLTINQIAVYPKKGWWAFRTFERGSPWNQCNRRAIAYSLIVSIETVADIPLYSEISNLLSIPVQV